MNTKDMDLGEIILSSISNMLRTLLRILHVEKNPRTILPIERHFETISKFFHERQVGQFLTEVRGEIFVDIGAYLGYYSLMMCGNFHRIFAFEPSPLNLKLLRQNIRNRGAKNISCVGMAVSDKDGTSTLHLSSNGLSWHSLLASSTKPHGIKVRTCTLSTYFKNEPQIDLVKVDVEGAEWMVLKGAEPIICRIRSWVVELHDLKRNKEIENWFVFHGYHFRWLDWRLWPHIYAFRVFEAKTAKNPSQLIARWPSKVNDRPAYIQPSYRILKELNGYTHVITLCQSICSQGLLKDKLAHCKT
jgi:FkbM family methyltransferase